MSMNTYKPKDFAKMLGVTVRTLQKWDVAGKLKAFRTPTNRRFYTQEQLDVYMGNSTRVQNQKKGYRISSASFMYFPVVLMDCGSIKES